MASEFVNLLITGRGTSGSWKIRGEQIGQAIGATVKPKAALQDCKSADLIIAVKRIPIPTIDAIRASGKPWVWDLVDFYPQPECTAWDRNRCIDFVRSQIKRLKPNAVIWPNRRMMEDCGQGIKGAVIYHHHRPGIAINPIRKEIKSICYEGSERYVGSWMRPILAECKSRGWDFRVNPKSLADCDIVLAMRDGQYNGYAQRHWKSQVKLANAHGSGTPFIGPRENGYIETATGLEKWVESPGALGRAFDGLTPPHARETINNFFLWQRISIDDVATEYREFLDAV